MKKFISAIIIIVGFVLGGDIASAAIAVDSNASSYCEGCATLTYSLTVGSGNNRLLIVGIATNNYPSVLPDTVSSVTYGGQNLTQIGTYLNQDTADGGTYANLDREDQWYLVNPPSGANNVVVTVSFSSGNSPTIFSGATSLTGVNQSTPIRNNNAADSGGTTSSVTVSSADKDLVVDTVCSGTGITSPINQTQQYLLNVDSNSGCDNIAGSTEAGASSVTAQWNVDADLWVDFASSIEPAVSSGPSIAAKIGPGAHLGGGKINF